METSALGRAEWMKFYGMLFGAEREADSIFSRVERRYHELMVIAKHSDVRRSMTMDKMTGSVWYVPGGHSTIGKLIQDANTVYPWSTNDNSGSLALPFESVFEQSGNADVWAFRYNAPEPITFESLLSENASYAQFRAFRSGEVYGCNTATTTFYEDTPFHPDTLLRDFIIMSHPDINLGATTYFTRIVK
jgi:iron complex transport system substrate-binding protein